MSRPIARGRRSGLRNGLAIGSIGLVVAVAFSGPLGALLQTAHPITSALILLGTIAFAILSDILAIAATSGQEAPFNAMASKRVPGAKEALSIVRNAGRVNSICADVVGDIAGTLTGLIAVPIIFAMSAAYPNLPTSVVSSIVVGTIAFLTIGGKAAEKEFAVRTSTSVVLTVGKSIYYVKSFWRLVARPFALLRPRVRTRKK